MQTKGSQNTRSGSFVAASGRPSTTSTSDRTVAPGFAKG